VWAVTINAGVSGESGHPETKVFVVQQEDGCILTAADGQAQSLGPFVRAIAE